MTIKQVNAAIAKYGLGLHRGNGYHYFYSIDDRCIAERGNAESLQGSPRLNTWSLDYIVNEARLAFERAEESKAVVTEAINNSHFSF